MNLLPTIDRGCPRKEGAAGENLLAGSVPHNAVGKRIMGGRASGQLTLLSGSNTYLFNLLTLQVNFAIDFSWFFQYIVIMTGSFHGIQVQVAQA